MSAAVKPMNKFDFLTGKWKLTYDVPESEFSRMDGGTGKGEIKKILNDQFVLFDYSAELGTGKTAARGIFRYDDKTDIYRYQWFEDSGAFMEASCGFTEENILRLNWHNSILVQTFYKEDSGNIILRMNSPEGDAGYKTILKVTLEKI